MADFERIKAETTNIEQSFSNVSLERIKAAIAQLRESRKANADRSRDTRNQILEGYITKSMQDVEAEGRNLFEHCSHNFYDALNMHPVYLSGTCYLQFEWMGQIPLIHISNFEKEVTFLTQLGIEFVKIDSFSYRFKNSHDISRHFIEILGNLEGNCLAVQKLGTINEGIQKSSHDFQAEIAERVREEKSRLRQWADTPKVLTLYLWTWCSDIRGTVDSGWSLFHYPTDLGFVRFLEERGKPSRELKIPSSCLPVIQRYQFTPFDELPYVLTKEAVLKFPAYSTNLVTLHMGEDLIEEDSLTYLKEPHIDDTWYPEAKWKPDYVELTIGLVPVDGVAKILFDA